MIASWNECSDRIAALGLRRPKIGDPLREVFTMLVEELERCRAELANFHANIGER